MAQLVLEFLVIFVLILFNGVFAMSELAIVSARKAILQKRANSGDGGAKVALKLAEDPGDFLATVQVGITFIGVIAGALGGATFSEEIAKLMEVVPGIGDHAENAALFIVVACITYLSLIVGELVPKRIALQRPETIACLVSRPVRAISIGAKPFVRLIGYSTDALLWVLRIPKHKEHAVTEEEIRFLIDQGARTGVINTLEREMVESVLRLDDRRITAVMTPRTALAWIDVEADRSSLRETISSTTDIDIIVCNRSVDQIAGLVRIHDLTARLLEGGPINLRDMLRAPSYLPTTMTALQALRKVRESSESTALVVDEFGGVEGAVSAADLMEAVLGDVSLVEGTGAEAVARADGSWLVDGALVLDRLKESLQIPEMPGEKSGDFDTVAGYALLHFGHIPVAGDSFKVAGWRFEVADMDDRRIDKLIISRDEPDS
ncbi:MAG: hemolysin family protein [Candidatus Hydrogenedentes bacterium]|nr:hemolysin family protein [Candidatus Hydrogenedentota bacterium]